LPVAVWRAVTVTPGSTPPVESVTAPFTVASCAEPIAGMKRSATAKTNNRPVIEHLRETWNERVYGFKAGES
jgi:hypothetical protein